MSDACSWIDESSARRTGGLSSGELRKFAAAGRIATKVSDDGRTLYYRADVVAQRRYRRNDQV
jgi:hypothetical protein